MQVILKKDIPQIGRIGELVKVRDGYARNFLIPRSLAVAANPENIRGFEHQKRIVEFHKKKVRKESEQAASGLKTLKVMIERRVNEAGKLFGSLSTSDVAAELDKQNFKVDRRDIEMEAIKTAGEYTLKIRLPGDVFAEISLTVKGIKEAVKGEGKTAKAGKKKSSKKADAEEGSEAAEADAETTPED